MKKNGRIALCLFMIVVSVMGLTLLATLPNADAVGLALFSFMYIAVAGLCTWILFISANEPSDS